MGAPTTTNTSAPATNLFGGTNPTTSNITNPPAATNPTTTAPATTAPSTGGNIFAGGGNNAANTQIFGKKIDPKDNTTSTQPSTVTTQPSTATTTGTTAHQQQMQLLVELSLQQAQMDREHLERLEPQGLRCLEEEPQGEQAPQPLQPQ